MTVEEISGSLGAENRNIYKFPVGMRVLAVDDDPTCLKLLEGLLRKCQYQVTTTSQARMALKMLRENRNRFDLVISDVHMPDMDGFKLLELVGLEMDLPVIMLSGNSDPKLVMKGVTHGACDYLVKPVRIEELRNIFQHVVRRKKCEPECQNKSTTQDKAQQGSDGEQGPAGHGDQNSKLHRKRKDDEDEGEENENGNEDPASQKKPRVVWSIELHRKFVAAVNQLGIEKAVPKRILDLMNVEGLSRENVASHLQKYRLYLKRISSVATQQANMVAALGGKDPYLRLGSLDRLGGFRTLAGTGGLSNTVISSYPTGGMLNRLNSTASVSLHNLASSALMQPSHTQNLSISTSSIGKFQPGILPANQNAGLFQGTSAPLELDQLHQNECITRIGDFNPIDDPGIFTTGSNFTDTRVAVGSSSSNTLASAPSNPLTFQGNSQQTQSGGGFGIHAPQKMPCLNSESSSFLNHGGCNDNWLSSFQSQSNSMSLREAFHHDHLPPNSMRDNNYSTVLRAQNTSFDISSATTASAPLEDSRGEMQCQGGLVGDNGQNSNQSLSQRWGELKQDYMRTNIFSTFNSMAPANDSVDPLSQNADLQNGVRNRKMDASFLGHSNGSGSTPVLQSQAARSTMDSKMRSNGNGDYFSGQTKLHGGFVPNAYASLDDLITAMVKREQNETMLMDGEFVFDAYSFGSCM